MTVLPRYFVYKNVQSLRLIKHQAMKTYGSGGVAPRILHLGGSWKYMANFTTRPLYAIAIGLEAGWDPEQVWKFWRREKHFVLSGNWTLIHLGQRKKLLWSPTTGEGIERVSSGHRESALCNVTSVLKVPLSGAVGVWLCVRSERVLNACGGLLFYWLESNCRLCSLWSCWSQSLLDARARFSIICKYS